MNTKRLFTLMLLVCGMTTGAWAQATIDLSTLIADYTAQDGDILTGTTNHGIIIPDGATITLHNAKILRSEQWDTPVKCNGSATIAIDDASINEIKNTHNSYRSVPGIDIGPFGSTLTINGNTGSLTVQGGYCSAGIGAQSESAGNIVINGGSLIVKSGTDGVGIGLDNSSTTNYKMGNITINGGDITINGGSAGIGATDDHTSCETITINDGTVNVVASFTGIGGKCTAIKIKGGTVISTGGNLCPGIGGHQCGPITISGGTVTAIANSAAGIGSGYEQTCGNIIITGGTVTATGGTSNASGIGMGNNGSCGKIIIGKGVTSVTAITRASDTSTYPPIKPANSDKVFVASNIIDVTEGNTRTFTLDPTAPVPEELEKDADGYYLIGTLLDWKQFDMLCALEPTANVRMTADIDLCEDQAVIGSYTTPYQGTFDGHGHTLTMAFVVTDARGYIAPFTRLDNATVQNLHVKGTITTNGMRPAGITSYVSGISYVKNCWSEVDITSSRSGDIDAAGLVARVNQEQTLRISDCVFTGSINYTDDNSYVTGGLVAWMQASAKVYMDNCLFNPSYVRLGKNDRNYMLVGAYNGTATIYNSYYNSVGQASYFNSNPQGTIATDTNLSNGTTSTALQNGRAEEVWVQDPLTNQPMLKLFAGKYKVPSSGLGTFSAKAKFTLPDGLEAYYCKDYADGKISVVAINGVVPAETGVLLRGTAGETYTLTISNETPATVTDNALVAVTEQTTIPQIDGDYTNFGLSGGVFKKVNAAGGTVKANRAYLHILTSELNNANAIGLVWDEETTGIRSLTPNPSPRSEVSGYYTLDGRKLNSKPTQKGLYINNGRKVVIK